MKTSISSRLLKFLLTREKTKNIFNMASSCPEGPLEIDGSMLEGGGQILRMAGSLSCLLGKPVKVKNIRAGRSKPGLRPQHLAGLILVKDLCAGTLDGGQVQSQEIVLKPGKITAGSYKADTGTAGSTCLLMQIAVPCLYCSNDETSLMLMGGTNAEMAPQVDYYTMVFKPMAERFGLQVDIKINKRGFFPEGGGEVTAKSVPVKCLNAVTLMDPGHIVKIYGKSIVAGKLPIKVAHIMAKCAEEKLRENSLDIPIKIEVTKEHMTRSTGACIVLVAETSTGCLLAGTALGKRGVSAETVGSNAGEALLNNLDHGGCVDEFLQDQLIILMALAKGKSQIKCGPLSLHTDTAMYVAELMTGVKFKRKELSKTSYIIECEGIGLENHYL